MSRARDSLEYLKRQVNALPFDPEAALEQLIRADFFPELSKLTQLEQSLILQRLKKRTGISVAEARRCLGQTPGRTDAAYLRDLVLGQWRRTPQHHRYVANWQTWFRYEVGVYRRVTGEAILKWVATLLENAGHRPSERTLHDVLAKLSRADGVFLEEPSASTPFLNVRNGLLDLERLELQPHTPEAVSVTQAPVEFKPNATAPNFEAFLRFALPDKIHRRTLQEFIGYTLTPHTFLQRALYLKGPGGTGKGTLMAVMQRLLFTGDYGLSCSLSIDDLNDGSPSLVNAVGKRLIYISEIPARAKLIGFKKIVGEDRVVINPKYKRPFDTQLEAKIVITANDFVHMGSDSANNSVDRRLILLPFEQQPAREQYNPRLLAELTTPAELSGILWWALMGWQRLKANSYRFSSYGDEVQRLEFLSNSNPVLLFVQERCLVIKDSELRTSELFEAWRMWCEGAEGRGGRGYRVGSIISFSKRLEEALRILNWQVEKVRKERGSTWLGLALGSPKNT